MKLRLLSLIITIVSTFASASAQDLPAPNTTTILKELEQITVGAQNQLSARRNAALSQVQSASGSGAAALNCYLQALDGTKYKDNHLDFTDWKTKNGDLLRSTQMQSATQLQLSYLTLALQRSEKNDALAQVPASLTYLNTLSTELTIHLSQNQKAPKTTSSTSNKEFYREANDLLNQSLKNCAVVQWLQIQDLLPTGKDFADTPSNFEQIMEKNIRVPLRDKKDSRLPGTWDFQINHEAAVATATGSQQKADEFNQKRLPDLLFNKAKDTASIGQPNRALGEIMELIHRYPGSPDVKDWVDYARNLIPKPTQPAPSASPVATPTLSPSA